MFFTAYAFGTQYPFWMPQWNASYDMHSFLAGNITGQHYTKFNTILNKYPWKVKLRYVCVCVCMCVRALIAVIYSSSYQSFRFKFCTYLSTKSVTSPVNQHLALFLPAADKHARCSNLEEHLLHCSWFCAVVILRTLSGGGSETIWLALTLCSSFIFIQVA